MSQTSSDAAPSTNSMDKVRSDFGSNGVYSMAGIGVAFRGKRFLSEEDKADGIALRTRWIIILWVPLIPLGSYRIRMLPRRLSRNGRLTRYFEVISKEPLSIKQVLQMWLVSAIAIALLIILFRFVGEA